VAGLGVLDAEVRRFPAEGVSVPQMGWNQIWPLGASPLLEGVAAGAFVYFANSYFVTFPPGSVPTGAETRYGSTRFLSAVSLGRCTRRSSIRRRARWSACACSGTSVPRSERRPVRLQDG
jgi:imidazoleglycerol phosphate synthase glutamine amidotransferase subunit HisH